MLDIMEMRGFKVHAYNDHPWELETPDGNCYILVKSATISETQKAFALFQSINSLYP